MGRSLTYTNLFILQETSDRQSGITEVTVMWYYSPQFDEITSNPALYIESLINNANDAYQNSNIDLRLRTLCIERLPNSFVESNNVTDLLNDLLAVKGSEAALRQTADIALLVTSVPRGGACGAVSESIVNTSPCSMYKFAGY